MARLTNTLVIMARRPRWGCGKARLAARTGPAAAWRFQQIALQDLLRRLRDPRWQLIVAVTPDHMARGSGRWTQGLPRVTQGQGDLGQRMLRQLSGCRGGPGPILLIGADIPGIKRPLIARAFHLLKGRDWVLGPAEDGGYWAIGARRRPWRRPDLARVAWGSERALQETAARLEGSLAFLDRLLDVDEPADLERWQAWRYGSGKVP